jgi:hypothetical protein
LGDIEKQDLYVYVASDSLYVCCPSLNHLLLYAAELFNFYFSYSPEQPTLRGAISYGQRVESNVLTNTDRVVAIPLLDESLPRVHKLEKIRKGSRIFLDPIIPEEAIHPHESYLLRWKRITGKGDRANAEGIMEFLWPRLVWNQHQELVERAERVRTEWSRRLTEKDWRVDEYDRGIMLQLDETLKLFIRSLALSNGESDVQKYLISLLPETSGPKGQAEFEWGLWFQVLKALCEHGGEISNDLRNRILVVKQVLTNEKQLGDFLAELTEDDYAAFKERVYSLLH